MKVLVMSDSHGLNNNIDMVLKKVGPVDMLLHLGDVEGGEEYIEAVADCPVEFVLGNNDHKSNADFSKVLNLSGYNVFITHGHYYKVNFGEEELLRIAKERHYDVVMYGHTHIPVIRQKDGIWIVNPGSISLPRQADRKPSFVVMEIDNKNKMHFTLNKIQR